MAAKRRASSKAAAPVVAPPIPILRSFHEEKTKEFYVSFLGFTVDWEHRFHEGAPLYMQVSLGPCRLQISEHFGDGTPGAKIKLETRDLAAYQRELLAKSYRHARPGIVEHDWGERSMAIDDPSGNAIIFFENTKPA
ncbi:MAG TPA: glyoxalase superfamily protein [Byssovorax sp.]|jgi:catechol 2,3-dioxygenase-like lactoylglutathione lyase family enzyme